MIGKKGERTKQHILETLSSMVWKSSYHGIRVDEVVATAEVNKGSFYQYFKSKEQACLAGIDYMHQQTKEYIFDASFAYSEAPIERLEGIFRRLYEKHSLLKKRETQTPGCPFVNLGNELATGNEAARQRVEKIMESFHHYHKEIYSAAQQQGLTDRDWPAEDVAQQIQGILNGAMISAKLRNRPEDILDALKTAKMIIGLPI